MFSALKEERNIFSRLYRYRPKPTHTPRENFITESFVLTLSSDEKLVISFLKVFMNIEMPEMFIIDSQVRCEDATFDIVVTYNKESYIIIECKMGAEIFTKKETKDDNKDQINRYANILKTMGFKNKGILYISQREPLKRAYDGILFNSLRWKDVRDFLSTWKSQTNIAEFLRIQFIDFLTSCRVDRTVKDGRMLWKCDICGLETRGEGIRSHKQRHCKEQSFIIDNENKKRIAVFNTLIEPYKPAIEKVLNSIKSMKIEMKNYAESIKVMDSLRNALPPELWVYTAKRLKFAFSNKAHYQFCEEIERKVRDMNVSSIEYPSLLHHSYENILIYKDSK
jgi:hypothetical protein